jgi:anti-sigma factor RsiW
LFFHPGLDEIEAYLLNRLRGTARYEIYRHLKQCGHCKYTFYQLVRQREFAKQQLAPVIAAPIQSSNAYWV